MKLNRMNPTLAHLAPAAPEMARIPVAVAVSGLSRSTLYRLAAEGRITLRKAGRTTLVDIASVRAFLAGLPRATIRPPRRARGSAA
jgi:hypothetical protein